MTLLSDLDKKINHANNSEKIISSNIDSIIRNIPGGTRHKENTKGKRTRTEKSKDRNITFDIYSR